MRNDISLITIAVEGCVVYLSILPAENHRREDWKSTTRCVPKS